jgi:hypothetical protein
LDTRNWGEKGVKLNKKTKYVFSTFVDWGDQSLVPNIGEETRAEDDVKEFMYSQI